MIAYNMYNGYNSRNNYLADYKNKYQKKEWSHVMISDIENCGTDPRCKGKKNNEYSKKAAHAIFTIQPYLFDRYEDTSGNIKSQIENTEIYKQENYFQDTGFPCYNNFGGSYFSFPMMCGIEPCTRYNYIMNNKHGSKNLLKNLADNNHIKPDTEISRDEWIIPDGDAPFDIEFNIDNSKLLYNKDNILVLSRHTNPYVNTALKGKKIKFTQLDDFEIINYDGDEKPIKNCKRSITQHVNTNGIYHKLLITTNIKSFIEYLEDEYKVESTTRDTFDYEVSTKQNNLDYGEAGAKKFVDKWNYILESNLMQHDNSIGVSTNDEDIKDYVKSQFINNNNNKDQILQRNYVNNLSGNGERIKLNNYSLSKNNDDEVQSDFSFVLLEIDFENYKHESLKGFNNEYLMDTLFDTDITCKPITLPASGKCERKYIHSKDYAFIEKNYKHLMDLCAGGEGFKQEIVKNNKLYGKLFIGAFAMLILYMLYRIDRKRKT